MSLILNIDTAVDTANLCISKDGTVLASLSNDGQKDHAGFLQPAVQTLLKDAGISIKEIDAIAISAGPGSYTGLRVGMATAKGLSYALNKPLISIGTLEILAKAAILVGENGTDAKGALFCPMIDARRMEVFTAVFDSSLKYIAEPTAMILDETSFANRLLNNNILFFGNGADKLKKICQSKNAFFLLEINNVLAMSKLAHEKFRLREFSNLAYCEPIYLKEFFDGNLKNQSQ